MIIYKAVNKVNGKIYVGQTMKTAQERIAEHFSCSQYPFANALRKYGTMNFDVSVLETCKTREELNEREIYWIAALNCKAPRGYNMNDGGNGCNPTLESLKKRSESMKGQRCALGRKYTDEQRKRHSQIFKGHKVSPETCRKISEAAKQRMTFPEFRMKLSKANLGFRPSAETRRKLSEAQKRRKPASPETCKKISEAVRIWHQKRNSLKGELLNDL